jgi:hypothetical protein
VVDKHIARGLDLNRSGALTDEEIRGNAEFYNKTLGTTLRWNDFWNEHGPDHLRSYRRFVDVSTPGRYEGGSRQIDGFGFLPFYANQGFGFGVQYLLRTRNRLGLTKAQCMEGVAMAFLVCGPLGMDTIALALEDFAWMEPDQPATYPDGWAADPDAFKSGLDLSNPELTPAELRTLEDWYRHVLGEVPPYVRFLGRERPPALKAMRARWENCFVTCPKQFMPGSMLHYAVTINSREGIRENVLLAKAFGVSKPITLNLICSALINGWTHAASLIEDAAGDVFKNWDS